MKRPLLFTLFFIAALCNIRASILKDNTGKNTRGFIECNTSSQVNRSPVSVWEKRTIYRNKNGVPSVAAGGDFAFMGSEYSENKSLGATYADRQFSVGNHLFFFTATHESVYGIRAESSTLKASVPGNTLITRAVYVDQSVSVSGDGSSWSSAYKTLSEALRNAAGAATNDSILVAAGTYYPTGLQSDVNRDSSFAILRAGIKIYGGYPASGGQRDVSSNITVLSGNIGDPADIDDNSVHVLVIAGIGISADSVVLDGVSFSDAAGSAIANTFKTYNGISVLRTAGGGVNCTGNSNENIVFRNCTFTWNVLHSSIGGAGMYNSASSPMLKNCTFLLNYGNGSGGGMFNENASPVIDHCSFSGNGVEGSGGAIYNNNSGPVIINCTFDNNNNKGTGGAAIYNNISTPTITNCTFTNNQMKNFSTANTGGACIFNRSCPTFSITGCNFTSNTSNGLGGAGIFNYASSIIVTDCLFSGNIEGNDPGNGAGLYNGALSQAVITNCVFSGNYAGRNGGGLYNDGSTYTLTNCTFSGNYCATGGAIYNINSSSEPKIQNTIIWEIMGVISRRYILQARTLQSLLVIFYRCRVAQMEILMRIRYLWTDRTLRPSLLSEEIII